MASSEPKFDFLDPPSEQGDLGTLSHYRVIDELGRGGMGFVFRAEDKKLKREVALKVMNQKVAGTPHSRRRFLREARAMAAIHHDNVATIFEVGENDGTTFMAMEMLEGETLEAFNDRGERLEFSQIIDYARQIASGLSAAHEKGIVHRDIKPANIWIETSKGRIKILDFGLALASTPVDQLAGRGAVIGTPGYLSPEQARTEPLDDRSDLYSLGVVLYELATGKLPLHANNVAGQLISILAHRPQPIPEANPEVPVPLADLIHRLLFKEPRARVRSAKVLLEELDRVENESHAKSEVAQTINRLQAGLAEVVSKRQTVEPVIEQPVLDPFAAIPDTPAAEVASDPPGANPALGPAAALAPPAYQRPVAAKSDTGSTNFQKYIPIAAIVALVMIALPVMTFMFSSRDANNTPIVVVTDLPNGPGQTAASVVPAASSNQGQRNNSPNANPQQQGNKNNGANTGNRQRAGNQNSGNQNSGNQNNANRQGGNQANRPNQNKRPANNGNKANKNRSNNQKQGGNRKNQQPAMAAADKTNAKPVRNSNPSGTGGNKQAAENRNRPGSQTQSPTVAMNQSQRNLNPDSIGQTGRPNVSPPESIEPPKELEWTNLSIQTGRGADAMVQIGTSQKRGLKATIGVHTRGKIESHHSYLRFDLAEIADVRGEVEAADLMLTCVGKTRPVGAKLRLYGIPSEGLPLWPEDGPRSLTWANTPSKVGLDSLSLLATLEVQAGDDPALKLGGAELAKFLREKADATVTLVVAGKGPSAGPLLFVSRQGDPAKSPRLLVQAPREPTQRNSQQNRSQRR